MGTFTAKFILERLRSPVPVIPFDIFDIASKSGIIIKYNLEDDIKGKITSNMTNKYVIQLNKNISDNEKRMSLAILICYIVIDINCNITSMSIGKRFKLLDAKSDTKCNFFQIEKKIMKLAIEFLFPPTTLKMYAEYGMTIDEIIDDFKMSNDTAITMLKKYNINQDGTITKMA